jgi:hypothetical protein
MGTKKKYSLTKWNIICQPKDQGGLGIEVLEIKNRCLLAKWLFKMMNEEGVWQEILKNKYLHSKSLAEVSVKPNDSPFWKGLMKVKEDFLSRGSFKVGNGMDTRFWEDILLGNKSLAHQYPSLCNIVQRQQVSVANVFSQNPLNISFRRSLNGNRWSLWLQLVQRLMHVQLNNENDKFVWGLTTSGQYTVKSMYMDIINDSKMPVRCNGSKIPVYIRKTS